MSEAEGGANRIQHIYRLGFILLSKVVMLG